MRRRIDTVAATRRGCYAASRMTSRRIRVVLVAVLASIALDVADADCLKGLPAGDLSCPGADCACCVLSEAPAGGPDAPLVLLLSRADASAPGRLHEGVRPVPYRPPLHLS